MLLRKSIALKRSFRNFICIRRNYCKGTESRKWKSVVGLEIHAQIKSASKLFSGASNQFASSVNNNVSFFDCATPGTLPVPNKRCVEAGVLTALALNCRVNPVSMFDRKHYFYADMPTGYQITQQRAPLASEGYLDFQVHTPETRNKPYAVRANIKQLQLEQDSGKSLHDFDHSLVDLNRAGMPLMEVVFEPDLSDGEEAAALVKELVNILLRIDTCSCKMEEGALRVDANVSIHKSGEPLGVRTEIKNIGSVRGVAGSIKYEIERQIKLLEKNEKVVNETRAWDATSKITVAMRDKEETQDYRYMPEPNLPPLHIALGPVSRGYISVDEIRKRIPELPEETRTRLREEYNLTSEQAIILVNEPILLRMFEDATKERAINYESLANILLNDFLFVIHKEKLDINDVKINGAVIGDIQQLVNKNVINKGTVKLLLTEIILGKKKPIMKIIEENNWIQINDVEKIRAICIEVINENKKIVDQYRDGKRKAFKALLGCVAKKSNVNMAMVPDILKNIIDADK